MKENNQYLIMIKMFTKLGLEWVFPNVIKKRYWGKILQPTAHLLSIIGDSFSVGSGCSSAPLLLGVVLEMLSQSNEAKTDT